MTTRNITHLVVHCSATRASQDIGAKDIDKMHRSRGFLRIGYHYVIKRDGTVELGRPESEVGAHVEGHNANSIGICMAGGVKADGVTPEANFTPKQYGSLASLLYGLHTRYPQAEILGHRDFPGVAKACPCFDVKAWVATTSILKP